MEERRANNLQLHEDVASLKVLMTEARNDTHEIKSMILGNGQPGIIQRLSSLEGWRWWILGVSFAAGSLAAAALEVFRVFEK